MNCAARGWSQETLAEYLDVSRQAVSKWEAGRAMPDMPKLIALAELFGASLDELVRGRSDGGRVEPNTSAPSETSVYVWRRGYEYKSKTQVLGVPLVHIKSRRSRPI